MFFTVRISYCNFVPSCQNLLLLLHSLLSRSPLVRISFCSFIPFCQDLLLLLHFLMSGSPTAPSFPSVRISYCSFIPSCQDLLLLLGPHIRPRVRPALCGGGGRHLPRLPHPQEEDGEAAPDVQHA